MKIGALTFHGSYNYGSVLQAYALQTYIEKLASQNGIRCEYEILNYRSPEQKKMYAKPELSSVRNVVRRLMYEPYRDKLDEQGRKFETFIDQYLNTTCEFADLEALPSITEKYDVLLAGSDQIWNVRAKDFAYAYLFEGCKPRKISYAASLGPLEIDWSLYDKERYVSDLKEFERISVREEKSRNQFNKICPDLSCDIHIDPTLLLDAEDWRTLSSGMDVNDGNYILFYCLEPKAEHLKIAEVLSQKTGLPVVATKYRGKADYFNHFIKLYNAGPCDFISLIDHAAMVLTSSFHGTAFSLLFQKPFYVVDGLSDGRICDLLSMSGTTGNNLVSGIQEINKKPLAAGDSLFLDRERTRSRQYLIDALGLYDGG